MTKKVWTGTDNSELIAGSSAIKNIIYGLGGDDTLIGGFGNDTLVGGSGADNLYGDGGKDVFLFQSVTDSQVGAADLIRDLRPNDRIDLSQIDADTGQDGDQAFHIVSSFSGHAGELVLTFDKSTHLTTIHGDVDGDGAADLEIEVHGHRADFTGFGL